VSNFSLDLQRWFNRSEEKGERQVAKIIVQAFQGVKSKTPVDTGAARGNWNISSGEIDKSINTEATERTNENEVNEAPKAATAAVRIGADVYIANSLPYIRRLEYGHSDQSEAMVRRTVAELKQKYKA